MVKDIACLNELTPQQSKVFFLCRRRSTLLKTYARETSRGEGRKEWGEGGGVFIYYSAQKIKLHSRSLFSLLPVHYSMLVSLAARVSLNIFFTLDMIILQLLDS